MSYEDMARSHVARVFPRGSTVMVEACLPVEALRVVDVGVAMTEVGRTADRLGSMLAAVHGGTVAFPDGQPVDHSCEQ